MPHHGFRTQRALARVRTAPPMLRLARRSPLYRQPLRLACSADIVRRSAHGAKPRPPHAAPPCQIGNAPCRTPRRSSVRPRPARGKLAHGQQPLGTVRPSRPPMATVRLAAHGATHSPLAPPYPALAGFTMASMARHLAPAMPGTAHAAPSTMPQPLGQRPPSRPSARCQVTPRTMPGPIATCRAVNRASHPPDRPPIAHK
jgi:hypothetical protein